MPRRLTDEELAARCSCGLPPDDPAGHVLPCPIAQRAYNERRRPARIIVDDRVRRETARKIAELFAQARAYLANGGRPL